MGRMRKIGFSVVVKSERDDSFYEEVLTDMLDAGVDAIELQLPERDQRVLGGELLRLVRKFEYRAVHSSLLTGPETSAAEVAYYQHALDTMDAHSLTLHPDEMSSWGWLDKAFGGRAEPENMDARHAFATRPEHMRKMLEELPDAALTFDVNHVLTVAQGAEFQELTAEFHQLPIGKYHLSGLHGIDDGMRPHIALADTPQQQLDQLFGCLHDPDAPLILETHGVRDREGLRSVDQWAADFTIAREYLA